MKNKSLLMTIAISLIAMSSFAQVKGSFTDSRDGKVYKTVTIGTQTWMAENLAYKGSSSGWAYNDDSNNVTTYGYLYDWYEAKTVCPTGWHLPTDAEWTTLTTYLGGESVAGDKLKEIDTTHWKSAYPYNTGATSESGFTALPGGLGFVDDGTYESIGYRGYWWSYTEYNTSDARYLEMDYDRSDVISYYHDKFELSSVRCVRDK